MQQCGCVVESPLVDGEVGQRGARGHDVHHPPGALGGLRGDLKARPSGGRVPDLERGLSLPATQDAQACGIADGRQHGVGARGVPPIGRPVTE